METSRQSIHLNNHSIHVISAGSGEEAILFIHGNSSNAHCWQHQLSDPALTGRYRLIAIDLPGHGASDRSGHYRLRHLAPLLPELIRALNLQRYMVAGHSYGTCLIGEAAPILPEGCKGVLLAAPNITSDACPPGSFLIPHPALAALAAAEAEDDVLQAFAQLLIPHNPAFRSEYMASYKATDPAFRTGLGQDIAESAWSDEFANLAALGVPACIVFGSEEAVIRTDYMDHFPLCWRNETFHLAGAGHFVAADAPEAFNTLLAGFAAEVFR